MIPPELAEALGRFNRGVLLARDARAADDAYARKECRCGRRLESTARTCRPCRRARNARKETTA